jgi:AraC-like DNA-binding protein
MTFREWRQLVQSSYAVAHLAQGDPVKVIASRLGYSPSAFSVMMRRALNRTPASFGGKRTAPRRKAVDAPGHAPARN